MYVACALAIRNTAYERLPKHIEVLYNNAVTQCHLILRCTRGRAKDSVVRVSSKVKLAYQIRQRIRNAKASINRCFKALYKYVTTHPPNGMLPFESPLPRLRVGTHAPMVSPTSPVADMANRPVIQVLRSPVPEIPYSPTLSVSSEGSDTLIPWSEIPEYEAVPRSPTVINESDWEGFLPKTIQNNNGQEVSNLSVIWTGYILTVKVL